MFSRILVKLIDQSIFPAILLLVTKIVSILLITKYLGISFRVGSQGIIYPDPASYVAVNSYSTFAIVVVLAVGMLYILLKSLLFHNTHISPSVTAHLFSLRLSSFIQTSFDLYSQGAIWLSYAYLITVTCGILALYSLIYPWIFFVSLILTVISTILLIFDIENEIELRSEKGEVSGEDFVLNIIDAGDKQ